jgi:hypothetical protein
LAWVQTDDGQEYETWHADVKPDGSYLIDGLSAKPAYVMAINWREAIKGHATPPVYYPGTFFRGEATLVHFDERRDVDGIDIMLRNSGGLILEGTVTDEAGIPVPEAFVVVHRRDMLFDFVTAYTDEEGRYRVEGLGKGEFLVHVDAVHRGFIRHRAPLDLDGSTDTTLRDVALGRGVLISGKFVDERGNDWRIAESYGVATVENLQGDSQSSFSLTGFLNKHRPTNVYRGHGGSFSRGEGDYDRAQMLFPTRNSFVIQGVMPGQTRIVFFPKKEYQQVTKILHEGRDILKSGIATQPGQVIDDVTVVVGIRRGQ